MTLVGNNSTSEAFQFEIGAPTYPHSITVPVNAPYDGHLVTVFAHVKAPTNNSAGLNLSTVPVNNPLPLPINVPTTVNAGGLPGIDVPAGTNLNLQVATGVAENLFIVFASANDPTMIDLWCDFEPIAHVPLAPTLNSWNASAGTSSWAVQANVGGIGGAQGGPGGWIVSSVVFQHSFDGGATWATFATYNAPAGADLRQTLVLANDVGVPPGPLMFRCLNQNAAGLSPASPPSPAMTGPTSVSAPTLAPISMTSWSVTYSASNAGQYQVQRSTDGGATWSTVATTSLTTYTDTAVPAGPLAYRVIAQNSVGNVTGASTPATAPAAPAAPTASETLH